MLDPSQSLVCPPQLLNKIRGSLPAGASVRLLLAGFDLPASQHAQLRAGYLFASSEHASRAEALDAGVNNLCGGNDGGDPIASTILADRERKFGEYGVKQLYGGALGAPRNLRSLLRYFAKVKIERISRACRWAFSDS